MANATIVIGAGQSEYTFTVPPGFRPQMETLRNSRGERIGERHTWPVRGRLAGTTPQNISDLWDELVERLRSENVICKFVHDGQILQELNPIDCGRGPRFSGPRLVTSKDGAWSTNLEFDFDIVAEFFDDASGIISDEYEIEYREDPGGRVERIKTGTVRTEPDVSAKSAAESARPAPPPGYAHDSESITPNEEDTAAEYVFRMRKLAAPLPQNVRIAERLRTESVDGERRTAVYSARFTGPGAAAAAQACIDSAPGTVVGRKMITGTDSETVEIEYTVALPLADGRRIELSESVTVAGGGPEITPFPVDGREPVFFKGAARPFEVTQAGKETWLDAAPPQRPTLESADLVLAGSETEVRPASRAENGQAASFTRTWRYTYFAKSPPDITPE